jgi:hypothetical protein
MKRLILILVALTALQAYGPATIGPAYNVNP